MFSVLIVEDELSEREEFLSYLSTRPDMICVGCTDNAQEALHLITTHQPHAIILDLELHYGSGTGFDVLEGISKLVQIHKPFVLITTQNISKIVYEHSRQLGADYILSKYQENYSPKFALDFLYSLKNTIVNHIPHSISMINSISNDQPYTLQHRISAELNKLNISTKYIGYSYLLDAIEMSYNGIRHFLAELASKYNKSLPSIERAMQNAIDKAWNTTDTDILQTVYTSSFSTDRGAPTVSEFVRYYSNKIKTF